MSDHGVVPRPAASTFRSGMGPLVEALRSAGVSPNAVSVAGAALTLGGALLLALGTAWPSLLLLVLGTAADTLDGELARRSGRESVFGAFLDSTLDRVGDAALFVGAALLASNRGEGPFLLASLWALVASSLVPYTRAKAESLGRSAAVGLAPREARIAVVLAGLALTALLGDTRPLAIAVGLTAVLATGTVAQRIAHVASQR